MSKNLSLKEQVENLVLFATHSKNLDNVIEEVLNFVRNQKKKAISDFLIRNKKVKINESFFSEGQGQTSTELSER
jgi:hypothetical protein